ncbi:MAG: phosphatase PAP2 family protein [Ilumatobacteraceae bacterium]
MSVADVAHAPLTSAPYPARLADVVRADPWLRVRVALIALYAFAYVVWFQINGLIIDRISVLLSVVILLAVAHVGQPWYRWRLLVVDFTLYVLMWLAYEESRGAADRLGMPLQVESVRNLDRILFFGADPNVWMQRRFYDRDVVHWYDVGASIIYYTHFVVPIAVIVVLWIASRREWLRFIKRFATVLLVSCAGFILLPTAPPWMAAGGDRQIELDALPPLARPTGRGWTHLGLHGFVHAWEHGRDWANRIAAMPSLHAAYALIVVVFFFPWIRRRWVKALLLLFPVAMAASLVYFAEHYVVDALAGWALVGLAFLAWGRIERRLRERRAATSRAA